MKLTSEEANVLMACKTDAIRGFTIGAGASGGVVWLGTRLLFQILKHCFHSIIHCLSSLNILYGSIVDVDSYYGCILEEYEIVFKNKRWDRCYV